MNKANSIVTMTTAIKGANLMLPSEESYPLEKKVKEFFSQDLSELPFQPTGLTREYYLDLMEPLARRTAEWQDERGAINDPLEHRERVHITPDFTFVLSTLIAAGRCRDLLDKCILAMDAACHDLYQKKIADQHLDFCSNTLVHALRNLRDFASSQDQARWRRWLGGFAPEKTYHDVEDRGKPASEVHNWNFFAVSGEWLKKYDGLTDNDDFVEKYLAHQLKYFTRYGMYKDPKDPIAYDIAGRSSAALIVRNGYTGPHQKFLDEMTRRGALTMLFMQSPTGQTAYGGRSNQAHWNEAYFAHLCELEALRYRDMGDAKMAGIFKRAAHLAALAVKRWLVGASEYSLCKNFFSPELRHGWDSYAFYSHYGFGGATGWALCYLYADDTIEERPAPCEVGGYVMELPGDFHKVFATACGMHLEIDTRGDFRHDSTGLGRVHKKGVPTELALSMGMVKKPHYSVSVPTAQSNVAIGPGWEDAWGGVASVLPMFGRDTEHGCQDHEGIA